MRGSIPLQATMKEIIKANDNLYQLVRTIREDQLKNPNMEDLKKYFYCDTLLRKQGMLYFCRIIEEIEYEEITN